MKNHPLPIEPLEARIAPARLAASFADHVFAHTPVAEAPVAPLFEIAVDGKSATFTNTDGDTVTIAITTGKLKSANFIIHSDATTGQVTLDLLDLSAAHFGTKFSGTSITVSSTTGPGPHHADIRAINASGIDLGSVTVGGDLGQIDAGDSNYHTPALTLIRADQMDFGKAGEISSADTASKIKGGVVTIDIGELKSAFIDVKHGGIDTLKIGRIDATSDTSDFNGAVRADGIIRSLAVGGVADGGITGGVGDHSGSIWSRTKIGTITVAGNLTGGGGLESGSILASNSEGRNAPIGGKIKSVTINGSVNGGAGDTSGVLVADVSIREVHILGSVKGASGSYSGSILSNRGFESILIDGDLASGSGKRSGSVFTTFGDAPSIKIGGVLKSGNFFQSGILIGGFLGSLSLGSGQATGSNAAVVRSLFGIDSITVAGDMTNVFIITGYTTDAIAKSADFSIGDVTIDGNFTGGGIMTGATAGTDGFLFTSDDVLFRPDPFPNTIANITSVTVGGTFTPHAIEAEQIGSIVIAGTPVTLIAGKHNDHFLIGSSIIKEIS